MFDTSLDNLLDRVRTALPSGLQVYLVGGAVRDVLLRLPTHDLDFTLSGDVLAISRRLANNLGGAYFPLDLERATARVICKQADGSLVKLDFAGLRGPDLESDLRGRDFTINAMALPIQGELMLVDPLSGSVDLRSRFLRACSPNALLDDPLRVVRGVRLAIGLNLKIVPETNQLMRQAVSGLEQISPERLRDELFNILDGSKSATAISLLDKFGALPHILPELEVLKGTQQSPPHIDDVWNHTLGVVKKLDEVFQVLAIEYNPEKAANWSLGFISVQLGRFRQQIHDHFNTRLTPDRSLKALLLLAALYHDVAKPDTFEVEESGKIHFHGHEAISAKSAMARARHLHLTNDEVERLGQIVHNHMRPLLLTQLNRPISRRAIYRYFQATGATGVDISILSLADSLATYGATLPHDIWARQLDVIRSLWESWWENHEQSVDPPPLVNGYDLMLELNLAPGPAIGQLLGVIREAQAVGQIQNRQQALALARQQISENPVK